MTKLKDVRNDYHGVTTLTSDIDNTETNIALLAFKVATGDSLTKFDMVDQVIDEYIDNSGIDTINSTNELLETGYVRGETIVGSTPTGGTVTTYGSTVVNTFLSDSNFVVPSSGNVDILLVAGGGGGGDHGGGAGGAGGMRVLTTIAVTAQTYAIDVGAGGGRLSNGSNSTALGYTASGGGRGSSWNVAGASGGSGGGGSGQDGGGGQGGGSGNSGSYSPSEGNSGGAGGHNPGHHAGGGGGGGAGGSGGSYSGGTGGAGGAGATNDYRTGSNVTYAGGGGGGGFYANNASMPSGGGGGNGNTGTANTGGGGGGGYHYGQSGFAGGSGIVVIKYADDTFLQSSAGDLSLVSTATTAQTEPVTGDVVMLLEDGSGTATLNTDIKAHVSRDDGTTWAETTLTNEGTWGTNKKILVARDVDISGQPSGTSMRYKIETFGQIGSAPHAITVTGGVHTDTSVKKFGTASAQFAAGTDALTTSASSDFSITGDFTIDCWCYFSAINTPIASSLSNEDWGLASTGDWILLVDGNGYITFNVKGVGSTSSTAAHPTLNEWNHFAVERSGGTTTMYKNGTSMGSSTGPGTGTIGNSGNTLTVGGRAIALVGGYNGYIDEFRFSKGIARYGADFTSPTAPYTIDVNTQLLLHMDGADGGTTFTGEHYALETRIHATSLAWK